MVITLNTVFRHVSNIFTKIGSSNRVEAAHLQLGMLPLTERIIASRHGLP